MIQPIENYIPQNVAAGFRKQAFRVWGIALAVVFVWVAAMLLAPFTAINGVSNLSRPIYTFFSFVCHQMPERSFHIDGHAFAVCSRCFGVYLGLLAGIAVYPLWRPIGEIEPLPRFWLFLSLIPISIDWSLTMFGIWENTQASRFVTGLILGLACATFIVPALVEISRYRERKRPGCPPAQAGGSDRSHTP